MFKNLTFLLYLVICTPFLHAGFSAAQIAQAKAAVSANPSLLNSPKAKALMQQHKSASSTPQSSSANVPESTNDIQSGDSLEQQTSKNSDDNKKNYLNKIEIKNYERLSPLEYQTNEQELTRIKSVQRGRNHKRLQRYSKEFFKNRNKIQQKNIAPPSSYIINNGDQISYWIYGATNQNKDLVVNNQGNINIPQIGPVHVAGERYGEVKELLTNYLSSSYKNSQVVVDLNSYTTAQITLTGFVNAPGLYNSSSITSVKDILIQANGVSEVGSVRDIKVLRNGREVSKIDFYHLLTQGKDNGDTILQQGDVIHIPRAYGLVSIEGAVYKEAIYEIERGESLAKILYFAGGIKADADGYSIQVTRYNNNSKIEHYTLDMHKARNFRLQDGDQIYVDGMLASSEQYVNITGNVVREGKRTFNSQNMDLRTLLKKEIRGGKLDTFFLENTRFDYAMIRRIQKDMSTKVFNVNLKNILDGRERFTLQNKDEIIIYNNLDTESGPYVIIEGSAVIKAGQYKYTEGLTLIDLINAAGTSAAYDQEKVKVINYDMEHKKAQITFVNINTNPNFLLHQYDKIVLFDFFESYPMPTANILGEVIHPGKYELSQGMSLDSFIKSAGGLNEKAYPKDVEIIRYFLENGERKKKIFNIPLDQAKNFMVQAHDEIHIKRIPYWQDKQSITLKGEVKFPGTYTIHSGEQLKSVIQRAGGFTEEAFLYGTVFSRASIAKQQQKSLEISLSKLKEQIILASLRTSNSNANAGSLNIKDGIYAVESLMAEANKTTPLGRIVVDLKKDYNNQLSSGGGITLKDGDTIFIPSSNDTVVVSGEVMTSTAMTYYSSDINDYISRSGGLTEIADVDHIYVLHANGEARKATLGSYLFSSNEVEIKKGDAIIVPKKLMFRTGLDMTREIADIFYKLSLTVAAWHTVGAF